MYSVRIRGCSAFEKGEGGGGEEIGERRRERERRRDFLCMTSCGAPCDPVKISNILVMA